MITHSDQWSLNSIYKLSIIFFLNFLSGSTEEFAGNFEDPTSEKLTQQITTFVIDETCPTSIHEATGSIEHFAFISRRQTLDVTSQSTWQKIIHTTVICRSCTQQSATRNLNALANREINEWSMRQYCLEDEWVYAHIIERRDGGK